MQLDVLFWHSAKKGLCLAKIESAPAIRAFLPHPSNSKPQVFRSQHLVASRSAAQGKRSRSLDKTRPLADTYEIESLLSGDDRMRGLGWQAEVRRPPQVLKAGEFEALTATKSTYSTPCRPAQTTPKLLSFEGLARYVCPIDPLSLQSDAFKGIRSRETSTELTSLPYQKSVIAYRRFGRPSPCSVRRLPTFVRKVLGLKI